MERLDKLLFNVERTARILEIGPSYNPVAPKSAGWRTYVLDYATQAELQKIYQAHDVQWDKIEPVDFIWTGGAVHDAVPTDLHGHFDASIASHVIEHLPNPIAFFQSLDRLLAKNGIVSLAVPDKRFCFDFFRPLTFAPAWIEAFERGSTRHSRRSLLECSAYNAKNGKQIAWGQIDDINIHLLGELSSAKTSADAAGFSDLTPYVDSHAWCFTPSSFELLILELGVLDLIGFHISQLFPTEGCEFIVSLSKGHEQSAAKIQCRRLELLEATIGELGEQSKQMKRSMMSKVLRRAFPIRRAMRRLARLYNKLKSPTLNVG